jgi:hypothetical protein
LNQTAVSHSFTSASLFKVRLQVGRMTDDTFDGPVVTKTEGFDT